MSSVTCMDEEDAIKYRECFEYFLNRCGQCVSIVNMEMEPGCPAGENFVGEISRVKVRGHVRIGGGLRGDFAESFIIKKIPGKESVNHKFFDCRSMFDNEVIAYEVVVRNLEEYASRRKEPIEGWEVTCFARYYGSAYDFIALEDLRAKGYQMGNRVRGLNVQECLLVLRKLSYFHAFSLSMKISERQKFHDMAGQLRENVFCKEIAEGVVGAYWENGVRLAIKSLRSRGDPLLGRAIATLTSYLDSVVSGLMDVTKPKEPFDVICHGDLWTNNIMLRYTDGETIDFRMIDLQTMRHSSCVLDVMHLLFTSLETHSLKDNFHDIISMYYAHLTLHMKRFDSVLEFTCDELMREFRDKVRYGLSVACLAFTFITREATEEDAQIVPTKEELSEENEIEKIYKSLNGLYHERLLNLVTALMALNLI